MKKTPVPKICHNVNQEWTDKLIKCVRHVRTISRTIGSIKSEAKEMQTVAMRN